MKKIIWAVSIVLWMNGLQAYNSSASAAPNPLPEDPSSKTVEQPGENSSLLMEQYLQSEIARIEAATKRLEADLAYVEGLLRSVNYPYHRIQPEPNTLARQAAIARAKFYFAGKRIMLHAPFALIATLSTVGTANYEFLWLPVLTGGLHAAWASTAVASEYFRVYKNNRWARSKPRRLTDNSLAHANLAHWIDPFGMSLLAALQLKLQDPAPWEDAILQADPIQMPNLSMYLQDAANLHPSALGMFVQPVPLPLTLHEFHQVLLGQLSIYSIQLSFVKAKLKELHDQDIEEAINAYKSHLIVVLSSEYRASSEYDSDPLDSEIERRLEGFKFIANLISKRQMVRHRLDLAQMMLKSHRKSLEGLQVNTPKACANKIIELRKLTDQGDKTGLPITAFQQYQP